MLIFFQSQEMDQRFTKSLVCFMERKSIKCPPCLSPLFIISLQGVVCAPSDTNCMTDQDIQNNIIIDLESRIASKESRHAFNCLDIELPIVGCPDILQKRIDLQGKISLPGS